MAYNSRIQELKSALKTVLSDNDAIVNHVDSNREEGGPEIQAEVKHVEAFRANLAKAREIRSEIEALEGFDEVKSWAAGAEAPAQASSFSLPTAGFKSLGQEFIESGEFKALMGGKAGYTMNTPFSVNGDMGARYGMKDVFTGLPSGTPTDFGSPQRLGIMERAKRTSRVRDLFDIQQTNTNMIEFFRVTGFTNNAATVAERDGSNFAAKPQSTLSVTGVQAPVRTIAHYEVAHRNVLDDEPTLRGVIDNELLYGLRLTEDDQILNGDGTGTNLTGIRNTSGVQTYAQSEGPSVYDTPIDAVRRAITKSLLAYYEPTGVIIHPTDYEAIELTKDGIQNYLMVMSVAIGAEARMWRLPVVETPAITQGTALVGSFGIGATLYDRMQGTIRVSEQHSDFFVRNAIAILAEERLALAVKRPESFVEVTFDGAPEA
jgi:HK97 family phage major capsid protein